MNKYDIYINKDIDTQLPELITFKQKKIAKLLEKKVFKAINSKKILKNIDSFNSYFVIKIKNLYINKTNEKSQLVIQASSNNKNHILT